MANSNDIGAPLTASETRQSRRAKDFRVIGGAAIAVLLVLALTGQATWIAAALGAVIVAAVCIGWLFGTVDPLST